MQLIKKLWAALRDQNFYQRKAKQTCAHRHEAITELGAAAWMTTDDASVRCINGGGHELSLQGVIDPLATTDKQQTERQKQRFAIADAGNSQAQGDHKTRCAKCGKEVVPIFNFKSGFRFTHNDPLQSKVHCNA